MTTLDLGQALRNAMTAELSAKSFYTLLADSTEDPKAKKFLKKMASQEESHHEQIREYASSAPEIEIPNLPDDNAELIETMPEWHDVDNIDYDNALRVALDAEHHAAMTYDAIADAIADESGRELFRKIAKTEEQHAANLEELMKG